MSALANAVFTGYFLSHIPASALIDSQVLLSAEYIPAALRKTLAWYCETFKDPLMINRPFWFKTCIGMEMAIQFPFFFVALYAFFTRGNWIRTPCIAYSAHACTVMVPILSTVLFDNNLPLSKRANLMGIYMPYFAVPLWMLVHMSRTAVPFPAIADDEGRREATSASTTSKEE